MLAVLAAPRGGAPAREETAGTAAGKKADPERPSDDASPPSAAASAAPLRPYGVAETVGVEEKLGAIVPLDLRFRDEEGRELTLRSLIQRPTILLLVYYRCCNVCTPVMQEVAATVDRLDSVPGIDYSIITVSFDTEDTPETSKQVKKEILGKVEKKFDPAGWRFLTGGEDAIVRLTDRVGFRFRKAEGGFNHAGTVIFLSPEGKVVRYLPGLSLLPTSVKMALVDAAEGTPRSFLERLQRLCYTYDPAGKSYVFKINRIILAVTLLGLGVFLVCLLVFRRRGSGAETRSD